VNRRRQQAAKRENEGCIDPVRRECQKQRPMDLPRTLASNLRVLRELRGRMGQLDLAGRVGLSRRTVARLENAEVADPGLVQVRGLAAALNVSMRLLTERRLVQVTLPLPDSLRARLESDEGAELLERMVEAAERTPKLV